jgi:hypothetical protein
MAEYTVYRGTEAPITFTVVDGDGDPLDLTGYTLNFRATQRPVATLTISKATGSGIVHATQSGATIGQATLTLVAADTSSAPAYPIALEYQLEATPPTGGPYVVEAGYLIVRPDLG